MSRDYKPAQAKAKTKNSGSTFFNGLLVGLFLGVAMTVALIIYIKGDHSPFSSAFKKDEGQQEIPIKSTVTEEEIKPGSAAIEDPNKFDFYTILPDTESKISEQQIRKNTPIKQESYFIQVGAFAREDDANNLKTRLALVGFEAFVQTADIPNKGTMHRVRMGPLNDPAKISKLSHELESNGFQASLIKVNIESSTH
ncbi:Sporulation related domain-containing protein [Methylophilus rhizosphaerae]|uniref:Sporulation related domain-containing protein n=1 Tax=Methylophilus rhizosphaerae TaxID=492660 RepID=A0A1G9E6H1_9PROT|nr:SPOR domain-containing protein [Methylophilus rhizosphaerae]SDK71719.1 Sporulation related domain-containing protein [Methylophilus rhizosphaerae]